MQIQAKYVCRLDIYTGSTLHIYLYPINKYTFISKYA
uniref:Uncharacterized protein n=1 Tax=Anguilla anguilla TaxID=7936 RepID=A0A0E9PH63_ANGAN